MNHKPHYFFSLSEDAAIGACAFLSNKQSIISLKNDLKSYIPSQTIKCVPFQTAIDGSRYDANVGEETELVMVQTPEQLRIAVKELSSHKVTMIIFVF